MNITQPINFEKNFDGSIVSVKELPNVRVTDKEYQDRQKQKMRAIKKGTDLYKSEDDYAETGNEVIKEFRDRPIGEIDSYIADTKVELITEDYMNFLMKGKRWITPEARREMMDRVNQIIQSENPTYAEYFRNIWVDSLDLMSSSNNNSKTYSYKELANACLFMTYRMAGDTKIKAYCKVFPERFERLKNEGENNSRLYDYAELYSRNKICTEIAAKISIPTHILYQDAFHKAMRVSVDIMMDEKVSPKVRVEAAANIMNHTKIPEIKKAELDISIRETDDLQQLKQTLAELSSKQHQMIIDGECSVVDVSKQVIYTEENNGTNS